MQMTSNRMRKPTGLSLAIRTNLDIIKSPQQDLRIEAVNLKRVEAMKTSGQVATFVNGALSFSAANERKV